jgi:hypothetical protein
MLASLTPAVRLAYSHAFAASLSTVFLVATVVGLVGFVLAMLLPERPLRTTLAAATADKGAAAGEAFAMPVTTDSLAELRRGLASLANREAQRGYMQRIVDEARVDLSPLAAWLLVRFESDRDATAASVASAHAIDASSVAEAVGQLERRQLVTSGADTRAGAYRVTRAGCEVLARIIGVRRSHITDAAAQWRTGTEDATELRGLARELVPDPTANPR